MPLTFVTGGARSGKSALALRRAARAAGPAPVWFVATAEAGDTEMTERIARHRGERPDHWHTLEETRDLPAALDRAPEDAVVVIDCLSLWVSNLLGEGHDETEILTRAHVAASACAERAGGVFVVTNEVGFGLVPMHPVGRAYRDVLGRVNATFAAAAHTALLVVAGRTLTLDPADPTTAEGEPHE